MQVGAGEAGPLTHGAGEGGVGELLAREVLAALIGERVVHRVLDQGTVLECHAGSRQHQQQGQNQRPGKPGGQATDHGAQGDDLQSVGLPTT